MTIFPGNTATVDITGTDGADLIVVRETAVAGGPDTIDAAGGNDVVIADAGNWFVDTATGNNTFATALDIDDSARWSARPNPLVADDTVPYTAILGEGVGEFDVFAVTVGAGETLTADIDFGNDGFGGPAFDSELKLFDAGSALLAENDDDAALPGGLGSTHPYDALLTWTNPTAAAQTVYIRVEQFNDRPIDTGKTYLLNVSVTGHAMSDPAEFHADSVIGGPGNDLILGMAGNDTLLGGGDDDTLIGGEGNDSTLGGDGNDLWIAGSGQDTFDGGAGVDTFYANDASFSPSTVVVETNLATGIAGEQGRPDNRDTLIDVENVQIEGSLSAIVTGSTADNRIRTDAGNDTLDGGEGDDTLIGGAGDDTIDGGEGDDLIVTFTDDLEIFFNLVDGGSNLFRGGAGNDTLLTDDESNRWSNSGQII